MQVVCENAPAVAEAALRLGKRISVIPAGERWEDNSLRPSLEDWIGAGAIINELSGSFSPEAQAALDVYRAPGADLAQKDFVIASLAWNSLKEDTRRMLPSLQS